MYSKEKQKNKEENKEVREKKPQISVDALKDVVKKFKSKGFQELTHYDLALALVTIGFKEVSKQFGANWTEKHEKEALKILKNSQYDLSWYGKLNNTRFNQFLSLCLRGDIQKIKDLIRTVNKQSKPQLISTVDNFKRTALHIAVKENFDVLTEFLINQGFSLNARDRQLKTPLHYCKSQLVCQVLLKNGANPNLKDNKYCTPAHYAATLDQSRVLQILLKKSNVVNQVDSTLKTPIFYAIFNSSEQQVNILRILVENGSKVNIKDMFNKTPLHYAAQSGKSRCLPFLLQKGASLDIRDNHNKTALDLAQNQKIKKILTAYCESKGIILDKQQKQKRDEFNTIQKQQKSKIKLDEKQNNEHDQQKSFVNLKSQGNLNSQQSFNSNAQIYTKQLNQVSTWIREKFFVLMKKLQQSGVKSLWHLKRPYIYTGSWAEDIQSLEDLYETFLNVSGPQAAMRAFNILCPYEKPLPNVLGKTQQAFQSFFGQNWFSNDPIQKVRNMHSQTKIRSELQIKIKQAEDLKTELLGYQSEIQKLQGQMSEYKSQLKRYERIQQDLRKQRAKNTQQYSQMLDLMNQKQELKAEIQKLNSGQQKTEILSNLIQQLKGKNHDLTKEIQQIKARQAATRRKCGQIFLKSLSQANSGQSQFKLQEQNLYDDDAIINLYDLLKNNPPNLEKRFKLADKKGKNKLNVEQFTQMLESLSMLPQDVMSMHRITGFAQGRKTLSLDQFRTILENRHKNRPMWQKNLIRKLKTILTESKISLQKFFEVMDKDGNGTIQANELRKGLQQYNIFMNQTDWCNLFNLLDSDKSGEIDLNQLKTLLQAQKTGKLDNLSGHQNVMKGQQKQQSQKQKSETQSKKRQNGQGQEKEKQNQEQEDEKNEKNDQNQQNQQNQQKQDQHKDQDQDKNKAMQEQEQKQKQQDQRLLQDEDEKFQKQYEEEEEELQEGIMLLDGQLKIQVPVVKLQNIQDLGLKTQNQVYLRIECLDDQIAKLAILTEAKQKIAVQFKYFQQKIKEGDFKLRISVHKSRQFDQDGDLLGEVQVQLQNVLQEQNFNKWAVNKKFKLQPIQGNDNQINGYLVVQGKWIPKQE